jgi:thiosulfate/3-mercaptopyruvate sulfurtransferase
MKMSSRRTFARSAVTGILAVASLLAIPAHAQKADPWTAAQVTQPSDLAAALSTGTKPVMLQVGFQVLYKSKHIPGSIYAGPGSTPQGLEALKQAVRNLPKDTGIYLYCGCCPIVRCPNIRPAYATLKSMGFTHLHVVMLETSFGQDWVAHGYPTTGDSAPGH